MVTWGLGGLWHGDFRTGDLGTWGLKGNIYTPAAWGFGIGLWIGLGLGDLCTWRTLEWGLQDWCLGDLGTFALRRNRNSGLDLKEFGMGTLGRARGNNFALRRNRNLGRKVVTWGLGGLWNGDFRTWGLGDLGTWGLGDLGTWGLGNLGTWGRWVLGNLGFRLSNSLYRYLPEAYPPARHCTRP